MLEDFTKEFKKPAIISIFWWFVWVGIGSKGREKRDELYND